MFQIKRRPDQLVNEEDEDSKAAVSQKGVLVVSNMKDVKKYVVYQLNETMCEMRTKNLIEMN